MVTLMSSDMYQKSSESEHLPSVVNEDEIDSKEFQKELMNKVFPQSEENTVCKEELETAPNTVSEENVPSIKQSESCVLSTVEGITEVEENVPPRKQSESCVLSTVVVEGIVSNTRDDVMDSKDFQKDLMSKVLPPSEEKHNMEDTTLNVKQGDNLPNIKSGNCGSLTDERNAVDIDSKDLMSKVLPSTESTSVAPTTDIKISASGSLPTSERNVDDASTVINSKDIPSVEQSENCALSTAEEMASNTQDDMMDSKDFQKDLMSKVLPPSESDMKNVDGGDTAVDKKESTKRKSNLLPLDAFFSPSSSSSTSPSLDGPSTSKKKKGNDGYGGTSSVLANIKVKEEEEEIVKKKKNELEDGEIGEDLEEGELRELEEGELPEDVETADASRHTSVIKKSIPIDYDDFNRKRKVALLVAYCGAGFHGMQKNPEVETIELRLMEALAAIRAVRPDLKNEFLLNNNNQISFNRAARTDKGVSAARQVVSLKLVANENFLVQVNYHLPAEIRVFGMERVTKSFDAKCSCSGRSYEYLVPTVAFAPTKEIMDSTYRLSDEQFEKVDNILGKYVGTHNFHNFTSGKRFTDKSAMRYITDFKASTPFECRGHEFIALEVQGQSFLIHQIRKMIGLCMAICRGYCGEDTVDKSWNEAKLDIPKAPGLGLLLNRVNYKAYNQKHGSDGRNNPLTWENCELEVERYKIERLWHTIIEEEIKKSSLVHWLKTLNNHTYTEAGMNAPMNSDYKGKKGVFPALKDKRRQDRRGEERSPNSK